MGSKNAELIKAKLLEMHAAIPEIVSLCEAMGGDDRFYKDEAISIKQLGTMFELQIHSIESHERTVAMCEANNMTMKDFEAQMDLLSKAKGIYSHQDKVDDLLQRAREMTEGLKSPKGKPQ